jgi:putative phosphoribosyl transferase
MMEPPMASSIDLKIGAGASDLSAIWSVPPSVRGTVAFAHGSGSSRLSTRNQFVAGVLQKAGIATLLVDLLTPEEEEYDQRTGALRFDVAFLSRRLDAAVQWCRSRAEIAGTALGLFGASTGAAAALISAASRPREIAAIVSRGGRADMAGPILAHVRAPTLLIVGSDDRQVLDLNQAAAERLTCPHELSVIAGATHLFEEPGALEQVARLARDWFLTYLSKSKE